jgi:hypothetical protein
MERQKLESYVFQSLRHIPILSVHLSIKTRLYFFKKKKKKTHIFLIFLECIFYF